MQSSAPATATLQYQLYKGISANTGTFRIYKNGTLLQSMSANTGLITVSINAGDTIYSTLQCNNGGTIDYYENGSYVTSYVAFTSSAVTSPTVTATAGTTYNYTGTFGAI